MGAANAGVSPEILLHAGPDEVAEALAARLMARLTEIQRDFRIPQVALTGGRIATRAYQRLANEGSNSAVDWSRVELWWETSGSSRPTTLTGTPSRLLTCSQARWRSILIGFTRCRPATAALISMRPLRRTRVSLAISSSTSACWVWDQTAMWPRSSPSTPRRTPEGDVIGVRASPKPPPERISLTLPVINRSREVWFVVSGTDKAAAAKMALLGAGPVQVPAAGVSGVERTLWLLDRDAAAELPADLQQRGRI